MNNKVTKLLISAFLAITTGAASADNGKPDLWQVEKDGKSSYLFGSIHLGSSDMYPLSKAVTDAYAESQNLVVEIDMKPGDEAKLTPLIQSLGLDMSAPIESRLSAETLAVYKKACTEKALPCAQFAPFKAWLLSLQLSLMTMQQLGYTDDLGIDKYFLGDAHKNNKNVIGLETADFQLKMLSGFNQQQQELMLMQSLQVTQADVEALFAAWKAGDDAAMIEMFTRDLDKPGAKGMYQEMFIGRNIVMAKKVEQLLKDNKSLFVVVGAGHIVGEQGLVDLLTKAGFKLTQLQ